MTVFLIQNFIGGFLKIIFLYHIREASLISFEKFTISLDAIYNGSFIRIISSIIRPLGRLNVISRPAKTGNRWSALSGK